MTAALMIKLNLQRDGEVVYVDSQDVPGLHVCGPTEEAACESAAKAIRVLFKYNRKMDVDVVRATSDAKQFPSVSRCDGFVVQQLQAA